MPTETAAQTRVGVVYGVMAGALWALVFVTPVVIGAFSPLQLAVGRYIAYGAIGLALLAPRWRKVSAALGRKEWVGLAWLGLLGNTLYYLLLATAVQTGGVAMTSLVIGFLPVAVTILGSRQRGAVSLARLAPSLLLCAAGAVCIGWETFSPQVGTSSGARQAGLAFAIGALVSWTLYAVLNGRWLTRLSTVTAHEWSLLTGVSAGAQGLVLLPVALVLETATHSAAAWSQFVGVSVGVALLSSVIGNGLWNRMSRLLPMTLVGQMILFETLFALIYGFLWEQRWPTAMESTAFVMVVLSVVACIRAHAPRGGAKAALAGAA